MEKFQTKKDFKTQRDQDAYRQGFSDGQDSLLYPSMQVTPIDVEQPINRAVREALEQIIIPIDAESNEEALAP